MKILYDYQIFETQVYGGISRYFFQLIKGLIENKSIKFNLALKYSNNYYLKNSIYFSGQIKNLKTFENFLPDYQFRGKGKIYTLLKKLNIVNDSIGKNKEITIKELESKDFDIFHPTYYNDYFLNFIGNKPFVLTIHDMIHEIYPEYFINCDDLSIKKKYLAEKASKIIAVSNNTKSDIIKYLNINENKIKVIYHGNSIDKEKINVNPKLLKILPKRFVLFIGDRTKYKNFYFCVRAISNILNRDKNLSVVCVGGGSFNEGDVLFFNSLNISNQILQYSAESNFLSYLYQNSLAFIFPSLYEGFGMPILEAFSCGCPVALSNSSSFPEVAGDAAVYFEPKDLNSISKSIREIVYNSDLREKLKVKGYKQLDKFSWSKTVELTKKVYESIL